MPDPELNFLDDSNDRFDTDLSDPHHVLKSLQFVNSPAYSQNMEKAASHYRKVMGQLEELFDSCLSPYGKIHIPEGEFFLFIDLGQPVYFDEILFRLIDLQVFDTERNPTFNVCNPVTRIKLDYGLHDLKTWRTVFKDLADFFASDFVMWGKNMLCLGTSDPFFSLIHMERGEFRKPTLAEAEQLTKIEDYSEYSNDELFMIYCYILESAAINYRTEWYEKAAYILSLIGREELSPGAQGLISNLEATRIDF